MVRRITRAPPAGPQPNHASAKPDNYRGNLRGGRIAVLNPDEFSHAPTVNISAHGLLQATNFMVDTGAAPNIVKLRSIHPVSRDDPLYLSGITTGRVETLGSIRASYMGYPIILHIVPDNFPIAQEGILGSDFLRDASSINLIERFVEWQGIKIPFCTRETVVIPARSHATFFLRVSNPEINIGYVPRLRVCDDVYLGDAVVTNREGKAYIRAVNTSDFDRELIVLTINLQSIECLSESESISVGSSTAAINLVGQKPARERMGEISSLLRLDHLNREKADHVKDLIRENKDLFRLPEDKLSHTDAIAHRIPTTDERSVNTKQYRFPPIHKDKINRQVGELLKNDIVSASSSPFNSPLWIVPKNPIRRETKGGA